MKILFVNDFSPGHAEASGAELVIRSLRRNCEALGHDTYLATCYGESDFTLPGRTLGAWMNPSNKSAEKSFKKILRHVEPDIVHFHNIRHVGLPPLRATLERGTACLYSLHDYLPLCPQRTMYTEGHNCTHFEDCFRCFYGSARQWHIRTFAASPIHPLFNRAFLKPMRSTILKDLNRVQKTVPTTQMRTRLERFGLGKIRVVTPGIDFEHKPNPDNGRKFVALPEHACIIGYYGRFSSEKGTALLSQAWRIIQRKSPSAYLLTTGKEHLLRGANSLTGSRVIHLGRLDENVFADVVSASDLVVAPSVWEEPFNLSISTALAMGKPVVATAVSGHAEQITHGLNGFLSRTEPTEFARYVSELIEDRELRDRMGRAARLTYVERFTGRSCALSYVQIYGTLTNSQPILTSDALIDKLNPRCSR